MPQKGGMQTMSRTTRINPIARTLLQNRLFKPQQKPSGNRRPQTFKPSKGKGSNSRQKDEQNASKHEKDAYQKGEQEST